MTPEPAILGFFGGALTMGFMVAAVFFLKFWRRTRDPLFLTFAAAFGLLTVNQAVPVLFGISSEHQSSVYLLRLSGFALIILAIMAKNVRRR